ncbi:kinase C interacting protein [Babesia ovis]|uniref:Kinase C interacting protein n=1 Tax=Babesia ovis TaxID=5869 RepID=A0A9W5TBR9_BABOV|nr:kinase C interacting protein [Babesia ovis]
MRILCAKRSLTWLPLAVSALRWQTLASLSTGDRVRSGAYHGFIPSKSYVHHSRTNAMEGNSTDLLPAEINPTVFGKSVYILSNISEDSIVDGTIPSKKVYEDDLILAFHDINPVAPVHILVIPKKRDGLSRLSRATEDHAKILGHMMVKVAISSPVSSVSNAFGLDVFRQHQSTSLKLSKVALSSFCSARFIKELLLPYRLRLRSVGTVVGHDYSFSLSFDEGLYLELPKHTLSTLGLANTTSMHSHKDDFVTTHMDVTAACYLREGSKLCHRTVAALGRLPECSALLSSTLSPDEINLESLVSEIRKLSCDVELLEAKVLSSQPTPVGDNSLLDASQLALIVEKALDCGRLPDLPTITGVTVAPRADTVTTNSKPSDDSKRRKVLSTEDDDMYPPDSWNVLLEHKDLLFKVHRTVSQEKNKKLDTLRSVIYELDKTAIHRKPESNIATHLRHATDTLIFRALASCNSAGDFTSHNDSNNHLVYALHNVALSPDNLFAMFTNACGHLGNQLLLFILCATSRRGCRQNALAKELATAPDNDHLYIICSTINPSEAGVIILTSQ